MPRITPPFSSWNPSYVTRLIVLGAIREGCAAFSEIVAVSREIAPHVWQPTTDVVSSCIMAALEADLLQLTTHHTSAATAFEITDAGRETLVELLCRPMPCQWDSQRHVWIAAKLRFLDALDPIDRITEIEGLASLYRDSLASLRARSASLPSERPRVAVWIDHQIAQLEWELARLDRFSAPRPRTTAKP